MLILKNSLAIFQKVIRTCYEKLVSIYQRGKRLNNSPNRMALFQIMMLTNQCEEE